jgi:hypothetical protein
LPLSVVELLSLFLLQYRATTVNEIEAIANGGLTISFDFRRAAEAASV